MLNQHRWYRHLRGGYWLYDKQTGWQKVAYYYYAVAWIEAGHPFENLEDHTRDVFKNSKR